jgi:hypothetical protein
LYGLVVQVQVQELLVWQVLVLVMEEDFLEFYITALICWLLVVAVVLDKRVMVDMVEEMGLVDLVLVDLERLLLVLVEHKVAVVELVVEVDQILLVLEYISVLLVTTLSIVIMVEILVVLEVIRENVVVAVVLDSMVVVAVADRIRMELTALVVVVAEVQESLQVPGQVHHLKMV